MPLYHPDAYALDVLTDYLSEGKQAPLYTTLVEDKQLTSNVRMFNFSSELAGEAQLSVRAFRDTDLDEVLLGVEEALARFAAARALGRHLWAQHGSPGQARNPPRRWKGTARA